MSQLDGSDDFWAHLLMRDLLQAIESDFLGRRRRKPVTVSPDNRRVSIAVQSGISVGREAQSISEALHRFLARAFHLLFTQARIDLCIVSSEIVHPHEGVIESFQLESRAELIESDYDKELILGDFTLTFPTPYDFEVPTAINTLRRIRRDELRARASNGTKIESGDHSSSNRELALEILKATRNIGWDGTWATQRPQLATQYFWARRRIVFHRTASVIRDAVLDQLNHGLTHTRNIFGISPVIRLCGFKHAADYDSLLSELQNGNLTSRDVFDAV